MREPQERCSGRPESDAPDSSSLSRRERLVPLESASSKCDFSEEVVTIDPLVAVSTMIDSTKTSVLSLVRDEVKVTEHTRYLIYFF